MTINKIKDTIVNVIGIPKFIIICLAGIVLITLSANDMKQGKNDTKVSDKQTAQSTKYTEEEQYTNKLEQQLKNILSGVSGVGRIEVMITLKGSTEKVALTDPTYKKDTANETGNDGNVRNSISTEDAYETVYESEGNNKTPYIIKELEPEISGVLIVCEGGDNDTLKKEITSAAEVLFSIPSHRIKVMKLE
ncbi:MAG: hypothetical protein E7267_04310 [Lachnospiraceae bacterium]|nr:hypothetical protein [Lachnospiraceae bacterium]